jgi:hypothetical protein
MKILTVGDLKKELEKYDDELPVVTYTAEDGGFAESVHLEVKSPEPTEEEGEDDDYDGENEMSYFKGDHPFTWGEGIGITKAVFINGPTF